MKEVFTESEVQQFITDGFIKLDHAFPKAVAEEALKILWKETGCDPDDPSTWTQPVIRLAGYGQEPFRKAANTPRLYAAFDQLVGKDRWLPRSGLGTFPIRFPHSDEPNDTGWHVDASFEGGEKGSSFSSWRINVVSKGRALLMLFLFSDVGEKDAPTRIRVGSHLDVAKLLAPAGEEGMDFLELAKYLDTTAHCPEVIATGEAGTVFLCHPLLVHAAQAHHGTRPRFLAQPPLDPARPFELHRNDGDYSPVEKAIRLGLGL